MKPRTIALLTVLVVAVIGCGGVDAPETAVATSPLTSGNSLTTNSLWQNGVWENGVWENGVWENGVWENGVWENGVWENGVWENGVWENGVWENGVWENGVWKSGVWEKGVWQKGLPGKTLRSSPYARQLLQYVYACAMPGTLDPVTHARIYDATLDPSNGTLTCSPSAPCDTGYTCSSQGTCVVPLTGAIGLGINADGSTWWGSGNCDESCQRWVSACVLARTNAYGVHVDISMRAPANAPQAIKDALATTSNEVNDYTLREGAYYGNIFATTAAPPPPPSPGFSGPANGPIAPTGPIVGTPRFYACAGPGSNIPAITKRFCSSQGDQVVINVPGVCLRTATQAGTCAGEDTVPTSPTFGAIQDCYTSAATQPRAQCSGYRDPTCYNEVITVYLKTPIACCGNAVCEAGESATCPSDCPPGWARDYAPSLALPIVDQFSGGWSNSNFFRVGMSALAPDDTIVVAGTASSDVDLGGGTLRANQGLGVLAKYHSDGRYAWGVRFGNTSPLDSGGQLQEVWGVTVASNGNIIVVGSAVEVIAGVTSHDIWISTYNADGVAVPDGTWSVPIGDASSIENADLVPAFAVDSLGNIVLAGTYLGTVTFGSTSFSSQATNPGWSDVFIAKVSPQGAVLWAESQAARYGSSGTGNKFAWSVVVDSADNIVLLIQEGEAPTLEKLSSDGSVVWIKSAVAKNVTVAAVDASSNVYAVGYTEYMQDVGGIGVPGIRVNPPYIVKYGGDGSFQWENYARVVVPASTLTISPSASEGVSIGFDPAGNVILGSFGRPFKRGGGFDFGVGTFPTYASNNIFLAAYSPDVGTLRWAKQIPTILSSGLLGMAIDSQGRVVVSGNYSGSMQVGNRMLVTGVPEQPGVINSFLASFGGPSPFDTTPPAIGAGADQTGSPINTVPQNIVAQATSSAGAVVFFMPPTAIDTGNAGTSVACLPPPNTTFPIGTTTVKCTASDPLGNHSSAMFTITVADTLGPVFSPVADITVQATDVNGATVTYAAPTATDQIDGASPQVTCTPASGSVFAVGKTTVTCTASDNSHNQSQTTFLVDVTPGTDTTPPWITVPAPMTVEATNASGAVVTYSASATDNVGVATFACSPDSGGVFALGTTTVTCSASDATANTSSASFTVTVVDTTPPVLVVPSGLTFEATGPSGAVVPFAASATDLVDGPRPVTCSVPSGSTFALGTTSVECTASDTRGNTRTASFTVTIADTKGPVFSNVPGTIAAYATSTSGAKVSYTKPTATDAVDGALTVTCTSASGAQFAVNKTTVTCSASDTRGHTSTATFTVWVTYQAPIDGTFFLTPLRSNGSSIFRIGRPVPVRFKLTGASKDITNLVAKLVVTKISNTVQGTTEDTSDETIDDTDMIFKYRPLLKFYAYRWRTSNQTKGTYQLRVDLGDGVVHQVNVSLKAPR